jgi:hypothetical protein
MSEYEYYLEMFTADGKYIIKNAEGEVVEAKPLARLDAFKKLDELMGAPKKEEPEPEVEEEEVEEEEELEEEEEGEEEDVGEEE